MFTEISHHVCKIHNYSRLKVKDLLEISQIFRESTEWFLKIRIANKLH